MKTSQDYNLDRAILIERLLAEGHTYEEAGKMLNVSKQRVHQIAKDFGLILSENGRRQKSKRKWSLAAAFFKERGYSPDEIASRLNVHPGAIRAEWKKQGHPLPERVLKWNVGRAQSLRSLGWSWVRIAAEFGVRYGTIREYFIRHGLDTGRRAGRVGKPN